MTLATERGETGFWRLVWLVTPTLPSLAAISLLLLLQSGFSIAGPWLAGQLTDSVITEGLVEQSPFFWIAAWLLTIIGGASLGVVTNYRVGRAGETMGRDLRERLYGQMQRLPIGYHQQRPRGDTLSLMYSDAARVSSFVTGTLVYLLPAALTFLAAVIMLARFSPWLALVVMIFMPLFFFIMKLLGRRVRPLSRRVIDATSRLYSMIDENLQMLPAIKAFSRERLEGQRFSEANQDLLEASHRQLLVGTVMGPATTVIGSLVVAGILVYGIQSLQIGRITAGDLVSILLYLRLTLDPLGTLADTYGQFQVTRGASERILDFFAERPEPEDRGDPALKISSGSVSFDNVCFAYPGRDPVLQGLSFDIAPGETVAITGENGTGKTTIAQLMLRFDEPRSGSIRIDGVDIADYTLANLRGGIGMVAQRVHLLNGTVFENIAYGRPGATQDEVRAAARFAKADEFIDALPQGYQTVIGDQGVRLSGGQRQRLSLARTLLCDPQLLILDEATAMFDPWGEQSFISDCHDLLRSKTVILITHRPASLALADRVLKLENGRLCDAAG
jgi:ABC-type multidrug transport system fused ATPase/permease subunit